MKKIKTLSVFILSLVMFSLTSCDNEPLEGQFSDGTTNGGGNGNGNGNGNGGNNQTGSFSVDFDSQTFVASQISATRTDDVINITGLRGANQETVTITVYGTSTGTYQFGIANGAQVNGATYIEQNGSSNVWVAMTNGIDSQGEITISEIDETNLKMTGSFNFTGHKPASGESKEFTNGVFTNISFDDGLTNNNDNSFFANIDGSEFVEDMIAGTELSLLGESWIGISATKNSGETIGFSLDANISPGTYSFAGFGNRYNVAQYIGVNNTDLYIGSGTITITTHDAANNYIEGSFEFVASPLTGGTGSGDRNITDGTFSVTYF